jgi:hypothetical protein
MGAFAAEIAVRQAVNEQAASIARLHGDPMTPETSFERLLAGTEPSIAEALRTMPRPAAFELVANVAEGRASARQFPVYDLSETGRTTLDDYHALHGKEIGYVNTGAHEVHLYDCRITTLTVPDGGRAFLYGTTRVDEVVDEDGFARERVEVMSPECSIGRIRDEVAALKA